LKGLILVEVLCQNFQGGAAENHSKPRSVYASSLSAHEPNILPDKNQKRYMMNHLDCFKDSYHLSPHIRTLVAW